MQKDRLTRGVALIIAVITMGWAVAAVAGQRGGLVLVSPPLDGPSLECLITNVSGVAHEVSWQILDSDGMALSDTSVPSLPPLGSTSFSAARNSAAPLSVCRVVSSTARRGDLKVTFCSMESSACRVAVTAE
jgi:hypothetical protein